MKVECIKDNGYDIVHTIYIENYPVKGVIYTVRNRVHTTNGLGYLLEEIINPVMPNGIEPNFHHSRFRPIQTDLEILEANQLQE